MGKKLSEKNNLVTAFWQNILLDGRVILLAKKFRKEIGMPAQGFASTEELEQWKKLTREKYGTDKVRIKNFNSFDDAVKSVHSHHGVLNGMAFRKLLIIYYYYNELTAEELAAERFSEFDVIPITDNETVFGEKLEDGVYIKIGPRTSINHIKEYLRTHGKLVQSAQRLFLKVTKVPLAKKPKLSGKFKRDNMIMALNTYSKEELRELGGLGKSRVELVAYLTREMGYKKGIMTSRVVKTVIQRRRKMIKALASE